jgi:hypothetical protein
MKLKNIIWKLGKALVENRNNTVGATLVPILSFLT